MSDRLKPAVVVITNLMVDDSFDNDSQCDEVNQVMSDPYESLAATLDKIPNGFARVPDGSHLRLLQWLFTPEEAEIASKMKLRGETVEEMSKRLAIDKDDLTQRLETMAQKGQIRAWTSSTGRRYALLPFAVGIYEQQLNRMDRSLAQLVNDYFAKSHGGDLFCKEPALFRVIPIQRAIKTELEVHTYQQAEQMIMTAKSWGIRECICKKQQRLLDRPCRFPTSVCIVLAPQSEHAFDNDELTRSVTREEALAVLRHAEEAGLIHCSMNIQKGHTYICNCCTCCCGVLRGLTAFGQPYAVVKSDYEAHVERETCVGCGACVERCQLHALSLEDGVCQVTLSRCIGCGVCTLACTEGALTLRSRTSESVSPPPEDILDWMVKKATSRGVDPSELL